jgi:hypothetical protein
VADAYAAHVPGVNNLVLGRDCHREAVTMATAGKTYVVEDVDKKAAAKIPTGVFPGTLEGLLDALDAARYRSAADTPKALVIVDGRQRQVIRRFENGKEVWSASRAEIRHEPGNGRPS